MMVYKGKTEFIKIFKKSIFSKKIQKIEISPKIDFGLGSPIKTGVEGHAA